MSMHTGMGPAWRNLRTDRSVARQKLARETVRRVVGFAKPHRRLIAFFLALVVVDASAGFDQAMSKVQAATHETAAGMERVL